MGVEEALSGGRSEFMLPRSTLCCVEAPGPSPRKRAHVLVEITTVLVAHSLQLSLRRLLVEEMQLLGTVTELKTSVAGHCLHINQL